MNTRLPRFDKLPLRSGLACAWGLWGDEDARGALNLITPDAVRRAAAEIVRGHSFPLDLPLDEPSPPLFGRAALQHRVQGQPGFGGVETFRDDVLDGLNTQSSSQWDGFRHVSGVGLGHYNGMQDDRHGMDRWASTGIATRGVLADIGRWRESVGRPLHLGEPDVIEAEDILECLDAQGSVVEPGDILLIRSGWPAWWRSLERSERDRLVTGAFPYPGLRPEASSAEVLWNLHVAAVASDLPALEAGPPGVFLDDFDAPVAGESERAERYILHVRLLVMLGIPIGELFDLESIAAASAEDGRYSFLLASSPINLRGATGSPPHAVALR